MQMVQGKLMEMMGWNFCGIWQDIRSHHYGKYRHLHHGSAKHTSGDGSGVWASLASKPLRKAASAKWMGNGIFVTDGPVWDHARRTLRPVFQRAQMSDFAPFEKHVSRMLKLISRDGSTVDLQALFQRLVCHVYVSYL